jgi:hypothetical protein
MLAAGMTGITAAKADPILTRRHPSALDSLTAYTPRGTSSRIITTSTLIPCFNILGHRAPERLSFIIITRLVSDELPEALRRLLCYRVALSFAFGIYIFGIAARLMSEWRRPTI